MIIIRKAIFSDVEEINALYSVLFNEMAKLQPDRLKPGKQDEAFIINGIKNNKFHLLVADLDGKIVGFSMAQIQETPMFNCLVQRKYAYIYDIVVDPTIRSQGTGSLLLNAMKEWAKSEKMTHLELSVLAENSAAKRFYEREGLKEVSTVMGITL
ncbi:MULTISPECIES: GNAT family N-acetyltransferase [Proteus]|jgi:ribosomal protein S18 acetylase RimI-like enzyme|uniref:Acetyltransferase n=1 Tax=Proteus vulgaris TaxID=585 RepID=A0A379F638_PROVU|nr:MULTISPECIES: GNAT family N-acetyltransferase [Proteus]NBN61415.1 GNAT family N-acetyltransferase [Proteus sp. G2639]RNT26729.1 GNAT family N-acetyltransferase [Proteus mirabilis]AYY79963.1 GNAT family N-acetyltransferase [Proteus vulgaris]MBG5971053.1 GNAT family N-acetyltransferase [Proteus vulgaris]MBG5984298.1 GNAT family N-acetyltransferase [Proteus vulgaris]